MCGRSARKEHNPSQDLFVTSSLMRPLNFFHLIVYEKAPLLSRKYQRLTELRASILSQKEGTLSELEFILSVYPLVLMGPDLLSGFDVRKKR